MAYLTGKRRTNINWLPTQVAYGMDVSDSDPKNWTPFGELHEQMVAAAASAKQANASKSGPQGSPARSEP